MTEKKVKGAGDGRRNNKPPEHGKIKPGEIRNPNGRKGKKGQEAASGPSSIDEMFLQEAARIVTVDGDEPISAIRRLIQEEFHDALMGKDQAARTRVIAQVSQSTERDERYRAEIVNWVIERTIELSDELDQLKMQGRPPPDILPHPDHVHVVDGEITINGPVTRAQRRSWEQLKASIKGLAYLIQLSRRYYRRDPCEEWRKTLKDLEAGRRKLMRRVPKGWNWREQVWCRDSQVKILEKQLSKWRVLEDDFAPIDD